MGVKETTSELGVVLDPRRKATLGGPPCEGATEAPYNRGFRVSWKERAFRVAVNGEPGGVEQRALEMTMGQSVLSLFAFLFLGGGGEPFTKAALQISRKTNKGVPAKIPLETRWGFCG